MPSDPVRHETYRHSEQYTEQVMAVRVIPQLQSAALRRGIDVRYIPFDSDPIVFCKALGYFAVLYSKDKTSNELRRGTLLIDCRQTGPESSVDPRSA